MTSVKDKTRPIRVCVVSIALSIAFGSVSASLERLSAQDQKASGTMHSSKRMADGKQWTTHNLNVNTVPSYCYEDAEPNCRQYGRLYTWESARRGCQSLGDGWRLPTDDEWRQMAKHYGGVSEDSDDKGKAAYKALLTGGSSGFNALLGGGRIPMMASMHDWKPTDSTGRHQRVIRPVHGSTTLVKAGKLSIVTSQLSPREHFRRLVLMDSVRNIASR